MGDVKWIKIVTDIFDDEKILLIESMPEKDSLIVIWFKLLCLAGKQNNSGVFMISDRIAYNDEMLATIFRRPINTVRLALNTFEQFGMIEIVNGVITIPNWSKHQSIDRLDKRKEYMRLYMQERREEQKQIACSDICKVNSKVNSKVNVNLLDKNKEKEKEEEGEFICSAANADTTPPKPTKSTRFVKPTLKEVKAYCAERGNTVDAEHFLDYYNAVGWKVGKGRPMVDWKASVRTWERNEYGSSRGTGQMSESERKRQEQEALLQRYLAEEAAEEARRGEEE